MTKTFQSECRTGALQKLGVVLDNEFNPLSIPSSGVPSLHGTVCLSNDSLLRQSNPIEELTTFAASYDSMVGNRLKALRDFIAPPRPTTSRIFRLTTYNENEPWETVDYTKVKRGILADFAKVQQRTATKSDLQSVNRGLSVVLDRDQLKDKPEWQQMHTKWLIDMMMRATILEAVPLLEASATVANTVWDAASNPDLEIKNDIITQANITGFYPTNLVYGDLAALKRQNAYESQLTAGSIMRAGQYSEDQIATAIGVRTVFINAERTLNSTEASKTEIIGSNALLFTALDESPMDASNIVRHVTTGAYGGGEYAVYLTNVGVKLIVLTVENYEYLHVQHTTGIQQIAVN